MQTINDSTAERTRFSKDRDARTAAVPKPDTPREGTITFAKSIETKNAKRRRILKYFGVWNDEDVETINEITAERTRFSKDRDAL
jgi:hypothetical protein